MHCQLFKAGSGLKKDKFRREARYYVKEQNTLQTLIKELYPVKSNKEYYVLYVYSEHLLTLFSRH